MRGSNTRLHKWEIIKLYDINKNQKNYRQEMPNIG